MNVTVQNIHVWRMEDQFLHPFLHAMADWVATGHQVSLIRVNHVMVIFIQCVWLYGVLFFIMGGTFCWWIVNVPFVPPHHCHQVTSGFHLNVTQFQFYFRPSVMPLLLGLTFHLFIFLSCQVINYGRRGEEFVHVCDLIILLF
jgi:hypothetical protein